MADFVPESGRLSCVALPFVGDFRAMTASDFYLCLDIDTIPYGTVRYSIYGVQATVKSLIIRQVSGHEPQTQRCWLDNCFLRGGVNCYR